VIAMMVLYWPQTIMAVPALPFLIAVGLFLVRWITQAAILNVSARRMGQKRFGMCSILWFDIALPLVNLWMLIVPKRNNKW